MSQGKTFERDVLSLLKEMYPWVKRNTDGMIGKGHISVPSPPDITVNSSGFDALIECKAVKGKSLALNRLSPHQHDDLHKYDDISEYHHGFVAVMFYNGKPGNERRKNAWMIPIKYWSDYQSRHPRRSVSETHLEDELSEYRLFWKKGRWWLAEESMPWMWGLSVDVFDKNVYRL